MAAIRDGRGAWSGERCRSDQRQFTRRLALWQVILSVGLGRCRCPSTARWRRRLTQPKACRLARPHHYRCRHPAQQPRTIAALCSTTTQRGALVAARAAPTAAFRCCPTRRCACRPGPGSHRSGREGCGPVPSEAGAAAACHGAAPPGCPQLSQARAAAHGCAACACTSNPLVCVVCMLGQLDRPVRVLSLWEATAVARDAHPSGCTCSAAPP